MSDYTITSARYAKNMMAVSCPPSIDGWTKSRAGRLASALAGDRYSNREKAYIMSHPKARKFEGLYKLGYDADVMTNEFYLPEAV